MKMLRAIPLLLLSAAVATRAGAANTNTAMHLFKGSDGSAPESALVQGADGTLYGTTSSGGTGNWGTIFSISPGGSNFQTLYNFSSLSNGTNSDGASPSGGLVLSQNTLYGATLEGGTKGSGVVFAYHLSGGSLTNLHNFTNDDFPDGELVLFGDTLFGTTQKGGTNASAANNFGGVYSLTTNGTGFGYIAALGPLYNSGPAQTNQTGAYPLTGLALAGNTLYGTASAGGNYGLGSVFKVNTDGSGFQILCSLTNSLNSEGGSNNRLLCNGTNLFGTQIISEQSYGSVFRIGTNGLGFTNLYQFTAPSGVSSTNFDGAYPRAGLALSGNTLYGTTYAGGQNGNGTVFSINTDGSGFTKLSDFTEASGTNNADGLLPLASLFVSGNNLYGTAYRGGSGFGTVFSLPLPFLNIQLLSGKGVLQWGYPMFKLYGATNVNGIYTNIPGATSPYTNAVNAPQFFFRLQSN